MKNQLVSVIIPIYNVAPYIEQCLQSVMNQTYRDIEVLLIDDCGKDDSISIARNVLESSSRANSYVILRHDKNRGLSAARNTGIEKAIGDYVYFLDSDDTITSRCIETLVNLACIDEEIQMVMGDYQTSDGTSYSKNTLKDGVYDKDLLKRHCQNSFVTMAWNKLVKRNFIIKNKLYFEEGLIHEDNLWSFQVACNVRKLAISSEVTYNYLIRPNSIQQESGSFVKHQHAYEMVTELMTKYAFEKKVISKKYVYDYIAEHQRLYFMRPLWNNMPEMSKHFYSRLRMLPHLNFLKRLVLGGKIKDILADMHYFLPESMGFRWYRRLKL